MFQQESVNKINKIIYEDYIEIFNFQNNYKPDYEAIKKLALYNKKITEYFDTFYPDPLENLIILQKYNNEIENMHNNIYNDNFLNKFARTRHKYFQNMCNVTFNTISIYNNKDYMYKMIDLLTFYIETLQDDYEQYL